MFDPGLGRSPGEGNGNLLQDSCLENPMDRGAWWATAHGVKKSQAQFSNYNNNINNIECINPRVNPKVNYGLWDIMMHQCRFIGLQQIYHLGYADNRGCCAGVRQEVSICSAHFCWEP